LNDIEITLKDGTKYRPKYPDSPFIHIADIVNPATNKTYREENSELSHSLPIGSLVELENGVRLFVVYHGRDCDMTPLYWLSPDSQDTTHETLGFANRKWTGGYPEDSLVKIK